MSELSSRSQNNGIQRKAEVLERSPVTQSNGKATQRKTELSPVKQTNGKGTNGIKNGNPVGHSNGSSHGGGFTHALHFLIAPVCLIILISNLVQAIWYTVSKCDGSYLAFLHRIGEIGIGGYLREIWDPQRFLTPLSVSTVLLFSLWSMVLQMLVPGRAFKGPMTTKGNVPQYHDNGLRCFLITMGAFALLSWGLKTQGLTPTVVYDHLDEFIVTLNVLSHVFCLLLLVKGYLSPSTSDSGSSGNLIFDYYWGLELYPRVWGLDLKTFTNCRFGLTVWALLVTIYTMKSHELYGFVPGIYVSSALQLVYLVKFFWWESGYMCTTDICTDRAGYYICWGCLVFVPSVYASVSYYQVNHPIYLTPALSALVLGAGIVACLVNYEADRQKQMVRASDGQYKLWGQTPEIIRAKYKVNGSSPAYKESILLVSGFWGVARHFHYLPELLLALLWTVPSGFSHLMPYTYLITLCILLIHRTYRDDEKCATKYGPYWETYCQKVPYKIVPYIF